MTGHNVLHTMGFDAFGLPAEQYAVQTGQHPAITTEPTSPTTAGSCAGSGLSHDPRRSVSTTDPGYYRWTQWIFLQIFNSWYDTDADRARPIAELVAEFDSRADAATPDGATVGRAVAGGAARRSSTPTAWPTSADAPVNWCPGWAPCVANEEVTADGRSDRGNFPVFKRNMRQWMMRITAYADRLIDDLDLLDWTDSIKAMQRNWIGRSDGRRRRTSARRPAPITVFTTRPDTLFGATFMVLAPEHPLVDAPDRRPSTRDAVGAVPRSRRRPQAATSTARTTTARRPACSPAATRSTRSTARRSRCGSPTTC